MVETKEIGAGDKPKASVKARIITKTKDTNIAVVVGKKKKNVIMGKKKNSQNVGAHILTMKIRAMVAAVVQKLKAMATMALEILAKTVITVGNNKQGR